MAEKPFFSGRRSGGGARLFVYNRPTMSGNVLYYGDNLQILREYVPDESVDLIYLDPPFNSAANYNVLFQEKSGEQSAAQISAFEDTWHWTEESEATFHDVATSAPPRLVSLLQSMRGFLGTNDMMAYLTMMTPRLLELHRVLKETGSIYLHCDPTASHYLKLLLDSIFGAVNFRNEIIWKRTTAHSSAKKYAPVHDVILHFGRTAKTKWNSPRVPYETAYLDKYYRFDDGDGQLYWRADITAPGIRHGETGLIWRGFDVTAKGRHWAYPIAKLEEMDRQGKIYWPAGGKWPQEKRYRDDLKGRAVSDLWDDIDRINPVGGERLGYPTQKPEALLERIVNASSDEGDVVLDPFCGCGTAITVAEKLHRRWIGIDITHLAIGLIRHRLESTFGGELAPYAVVGEPSDLRSAEALALHDRYQFQWWAVGLVGARAAQDKKKGRDAGVDGYLFFFDDTSGKVKKIVLQVKSGALKPDDLRALGHVAEREQAQIGALITLRRPSAGMVKEAVAAGFYQSPFGRFPRLQILTVEELLAGRSLEYPRTVNVTHKQAERQRKVRPDAQPALLSFAHPADEAEPEDRR